MARLHIDHNVSAVLVTLLRAGGHDIVTAGELALTAAGDDVHLLAAAEDRRALLTYNKKDFRLLHDAWRHWSVAWQVVPRHADSLILKQPPKWPTPEAAPEVDRFLRSARALDNELYEWRRASGRVRRP